MVYNAAIIGCGKIGCGIGTKINYKNIYTHAGGYNKCSDTKLVALCDYNLDHAADASGIWSVNNIYSNIDSLFEHQDLDIISICTPDNSHYDLIRSIIENYELKCIFAEKPLALNSIQAENIVNLAEDKGVMLAVNYSRRFDLMHQEIKKSVLGGEIGKIQTVNGYYTKGTFHNGTHWFDLARFFFGEIKSVVGYDTLHEKSDDPTYNLYLNFNAGFSGYLHSCNKNSYAVFEMDILGTDGRIRIYDLGHKCEYYCVKESPYYSGYSNLSLKECLENGIKDTLFNAVSNIVDSLDNGLSPLCSGNDGLMAVKIAEAASKSVKGKNSLCTIS